MLQTRVCLIGCFMKPFIQMFIIATFCRNEVGAEMAEACFGSQLNLICNETKVIRITIIVLGDSSQPYCQPSSCCPTRHSCTASPDATHVNAVKRQCNGRRDCSVSVIREQIRCGLQHSKNNDFERITYNCTGSETTSATSETTGDYGNETNTETLSKRNIIAKDNLVAVVFGVIGLIVLIIIIVILVIIRRRKSLTKIKSEVEMQDVRNVQNETTYANENEGQNANTLSTDRVNGDQRQQMTTTGTSLHETPNNVIEYDIVNHDMYATVTKTGDNLMRNDDSIPSKSGDDSYSLAGDPYSPKNYDSADKSTNADNIYDDVEPRPVDITVKSQTNTNNRDKEKNGNRNMNRLTDTVTKAALSSQSVTSPKIHNYANISNPKTGEGFYKNTGEAEDVSSTSPNYEPMSPVFLDGIYANEKVVPFRQESVRSSVGGGSEAGSPYCDMRSPSVRFQNDGALIVVDNDLYSQ